MVDHFTVDLFTVDHFTDMDLFTTYAPKMGGPFYRGPFYRIVQNMVDHFTMDLFTVDVFTVDHFTGMDLFTTCSKNGWTILPWTFLPWTFLPWTILPWTFLPIFSQTPSPPSPWQNSDPYLPIERDGPFADQHNYWLTVILLPILSH